MRLLLMIWLFVVWFARLVARIATFIYITIGFLVVAFAVVMAFLVWGVVSDVDGDYRGSFVSSIFQWEDTWQDTVALEDYPDEFFLSVDMDDLLLSLEDVYQGRPFKLLLPKMLEHVAQDDRVKGVVLRFDSYSPGISDVQYFARVFSKLAETDKKIYAHVGSYVDLASYTLLQQADDIWVSPLSTLWLAGYGYKDLYYADLLESLGTSAVVLKREKYKSGADNLLYSEASQFEREQIETLLDDFYNQSRDMSLVGERIRSGDDFDAMVNSGVYTSFSAMNRGLVDYIGYFHELERVLEDELVGEENEPEERDESAFVDFYSYMGSFVDSELEDLGDDENQVVYLNMEGPIYSAFSTGSSFFDDSYGINSNEWDGIIDDLAADDDTKGVVLRISSGGGEAFASDVLWGAIKKLNNEKPVVILVDNIAASGGYYIASAGEKIVMERGAITGSIGVLFAYLEHGRLLDRIGVNAEDFEKGRFASGLISSFDKPDKEELEKLNEQLDHVYTLFVARVSEGRDMSEDEVERLAQGRVWSGERALEKGLADVEGGLPEAVEEMKQLLGIEEDSELTVYAYEREENIGDILAKLEHVSVYMKKLSVGFLSLMHSLGLGADGSNGHIMMRYSGYGQ